jgi:hypothetical protein
VTKPVKVSPRWRPAERLSRRSREHRPTVGVLEPPQVTPMCLLGSPLWHSGPSKHRAAGLPSENQQRLCRGQAGPTIENDEPTFNWRRVGKSKCCYESFGLLPSGHTPCGLHRKVYSRTLAGAHNLVLRSGVANSLHIPRSSVAGRAAEGSVANDPFRTSGLISVCVRFCAISYSLPDRKVLGFFRVAYPPHDLHNLTGPSSHPVCLVKDDEGQ